MIVTSEPETNRNMLAEVAKLNSRSILVYLPLLESGDGMGRRRLQRKGNLYKQGGYWKLRWRIDVPKTPENQSGREWSAPVWLAPCAGPEAVSKREAQRIAWDEHLSKLDANIRTPKSGMSLRHF